VLLVYECMVSKFSIKCKDKPVLLLFRFIWIAFILPKMNVTNILLTLQTFNECNYALYIIPVQI